MIEKTLEGKKKKKKERKNWPIRNGRTTVSQMEWNCRHIFTLNSCRLLETFQRRALEGIGISRRRSVRIRLLTRDLPRRYSLNRAIAANFRDASS